MSLATTLQYRCDSAYWLSFVREVRNLGMNYRKQNLTIPNIFTIGNNTSVFRTTYNLDGIYYPMSGYYDETGISIGAMDNSFNYQSKYLFDVSDELVWGVYYDSVSNYSQYAVSEIQLDVPNMSYAITREYVEREGVYEEFKDWLLITSCEPYKNDRGVKYDAYTPRVLYPNSSHIGACIPIKVDQYRRYSDPDRFTVYDNTCHPCINLRGAILYPPQTSGSGYPQYGLTPTMRVNVASDIPFLGVTLKINGKYYTAFPNEEAITEFFKKWGMPCLFGDDIYTGSTPIVGQPDNPDPDDTPEGTGDNSSDGVHIPNVTAAPIALYNKLWINEENTVNLRNFLFSETFLNDIRRLWTDPIESVVSLVWYPFNPLNVHNMPILLEDRGANIGNITNITTVQGYPMLLNPTVDTVYIDMGSITIEPYFGRYLDYSGYTDISIYIPYVGEFDLDTNEVMGKTLKLIYYPDLLVNTFLAILYADNQPIAQYTGSMGVQVPLGGTAYNDYYKEILGSIINTHTNMATTAASGNVGGAALNGVQGVLDVATTQMSVKQVGALTPNSAIFSPQAPYVRISRPYMSRPAAWETLRGNGAGYSTILENCTGYVEVESVRLVGDEYITADEQNEIITLLKEGVYI